MDNIDNFNQITVWILGKLYESFPNPVDFKESEFEDSETFQNTVIFLKDNGFIRIRNIAEMMGGKVEFFSVVLTMPGLSVLNSVPDSVKGEQTLGQKVQGITKNGVKEISKEVLKTVVAEVFKNLIT